MNPPVVYGGEASISPVTPTLLESEAPNNALSDAVEGSSYPARRAAGDIGSESDCDVRAVDLAERSSPNLHLRNECGARCEQVAEVLANSSSTAEDCCKISAHGEREVEHVACNVGSKDKHCRTSECVEEKDDISVRKFGSFKVCNEINIPYKDKVEGLVKSGSSDRDFPIYDVCGEQTVDSFLDNCGIIKSRTKVDSHDEQKDESLVQDLRFCENMDNLNVLGSQRKDENLVDLLKTVNSSVADNQLLSSESVLQVLNVHSLKRVTRSAAQKNLQEVKNNQMNSSCSKTDRVTCQGAKVDSSSRFTRSQISPEKSKSTNLVTDITDGLAKNSKISLTKIPGNVRELLMTGMLEGLQVVYSAPRLKQPWLHGIIQGREILCFCSSCKGCNTVSPYNFERHADSNKKHPADYICLANGMSFRDILNECAMAPLEQLEATIQNAIGPYAPKGDHVCRECKKPINAANNGDTELLCDTCRNLQLPHKLGVSSASPCCIRSRGSTLLQGAIDNGCKKLPLRKTNSLGGKLTTKDHRLHKLVFTSNILPEGTEVTYVAHAKVILRGHIKDHGIYCSHCGEVVSPSIFEAHAGKAACRKPYHSIYTSNGVSLHELSVRISLEHKISTGENDDICTMCKDGGTLLCCDLCPRAFHSECVGLSDIPDGNWHCRYCDFHIKEQSLACNSNAIAAGRVAGVDPVEQILKRCIRIVTTPETALGGGCALCKGHEFSGPVFDALTVLICDQCGREYHVGCLKEHGIADLHELPEGIWCCSVDCIRIRSSLEVLLSHEALPLSASDLGIIKKKCKVRGLNNDVDIDISWKLVCGTDASADTKLLLSKAIAIFHESFDPIIDASTGEDLIPAMVYGRNLKDYDYTGMFCAILTTGTSVVSAGLLRVFGCEIAELPLVATSKDSQGLGYFQSLFACIERLLTSLKIKHLVLPTAYETERIWTSKFGFSKIAVEQLEEYSRGARLTVFQGTEYLHKSVPDRRFG